MKTFVSAIIITLITLGCKDKSNEQADNKPATITTNDTISSTDPKRYLPVADFIREDIRNIDSFATGILLRKTTGNKRDSTYINPIEFKKLANQFLPAELDSATFHAQFTESSLADPGSEVLNFIYTANTDKTSLRKIILYITPTQTGDKISRIYMEKQIVSGDTSVSQKLTWKMKEYLIIAENKQTNSGFNSTEVRKAVWDPQKFAEQ